MALAASAANPADGPPVDYIVRRGDTFSQLTKDYLVPGRQWREVMSLTRVRHDRRLPVGTTIRIPRSWLRWTSETAQIASARGTVTLVDGGRSTTLVAGARIAEGAELMTGTDSFTTLQFANGSKITLPSRSHVAVKRLRKLVINGVIDYAFQLQDGRLDTRVTPLRDQTGRYIISTPLAMTAVRGTDYAVGFDPASGNSGTAVFEGAVAVSPVSEVAPLLVPAQFGAVTDATGKSEMVALVSAPSLENPGRVQKDDIVSFDLTPVPGATRYQIMLATDAGFVDTFRELLSPSPHFELTDVPNGNQFVRVSALAGNGLEGNRQAYGFSRRLASIHAEVASTPDGYRFRWFGSGEGARHFRLQIFQESALDTPVVDEAGLELSDVLVRKLPPGVYQWRVLLRQTDAEGLIENATPMEKLTIAAPDGG